MPKLVRITKDGQESFVLPESVHVWESNGWKTAKPAKKSEAKSESTASGE